MKEENQEKKSYASLELFNLSLKIKFNYSRLLTFV